MTKTPKGPYKVLASREVYHNDWLRLQEDQVIRPGGTPGAFAVVELKTGVSVLALTEHAEVYLAQEYKYSIARDSLEVVSGAMEETETPLAAAQRELREELGIEAREWIELGAVDHCATQIRAVTFLFLALGVQEAEPHPDPGEVVHVITLPFSRAIELVMRSEITHSLSCVLILKAARYLQQPQHE